MTVIVLNVAVVNTGPVTDRAGAGRPREPADAPLTGGETRENGS